MFYDSFLVLSNWSTSGMSVPIKSVAHILLFIILLLVWKLLRFDYEEGSNDDIIGSCEWLDDDSNCRKV